MRITLTELEIIFENVEVVKVPAKYIVKLEIEGIKGNFYFMQDSDEFNNYKEKTAEKIFLVISKSAMNQIFVEISESVMIQIENKTEYELFKRVCRYDDIVYFELKYSDGTEEKIVTPWKDAWLGGEENSLQKHYFDNEKNLVVEIGNINDRNS